jgi:hypothetical protein
LQRDRRCRCIGKRAMTHCVDRRRDNVLTRAAKFVKQYCLAAAGAVAYLRQMMQRLTARLLLLLFVVSGNFAPLVQAISVPHPHACCLRTGSHHCQGSSSETGFRATGRTCPYSAPLPLTIFTGFEAPNFSIASPSVAGLIATETVCRDYRDVAQRLSARAPPASFLYTA